jgi:hypothetical protein
VKVTRDIVLNRRTLITGLLFISVILAGYYGAAYCYLISKYPTSMSEIKQNLKSAGLTVRYKVEEKKRVNYSEMDLVQDISEKNSEMLNYYLYNIMRVELIILSVALFLAAGIMVIRLYPNNGK